VHFILLGLLWGSAWLHMALVGHRRAVLPAPLADRAGSPRRSPPVHVVASPDEPSEVV
jgi:hypothetical protein